MPLDEVAELLGGVVAAGVCGEEVAQVAQHLLDPLPVLRGRVLEGLLHPREALVEQLAPEQVLDLLVGLPGIAAAPRVVGQLGDGGRRGCRQPLHPQLGEPCVVVEVAGELLALGEHGLVEQPAHLVERAPEGVPFQQLAPPLRHLPRQLVEPDPGCRALAEQLANRPLGGHPGHDVLTDGVEGLAQVDGGCEGIRPSCIPGIARRATAGRATCIRSTGARPTGIRPSAACAPAARPAHP